MMEKDKTTYCHYFDKRMQRIIICEWSDENKSTREGLLELNATVKEEVANTEVRRSASICFSC